MAYRELIKSFGRIRDYMRDFYVYGFKSREAYTRKSLRSYDDERRRLESWLGDYMRFRQRADGKAVFLSIDSRVTRHNPLYAAWKTKSFTDGDITLHFLLLDVLHHPEVALTIQEMLAELDQRQQGFDAPRAFDESTLRKKLKEYVAEGIIHQEKRGRVALYRRAAGADPLDADVLDFFSEAAPCGVIGGYLLDQAAPHEGHFTFKHHYITGAMDSEVVCSLLLAMSEKRYVTITTVNRHQDRVTAHRVVPLRLMIGAQGGRQHLMAYVPSRRRIATFRTDHMVAVALDDPCDAFDEKRRVLDGMMPHIWGVSAEGRSGQRLEQVTFTVRYGDGEEHIHQRLEREKRCGTVERLDQHTSRFSAQVYDASEVVPWMRTFICRITACRFSDEALQTMFAADLKQMFAMYGLEDAP